jgi:hypothetical protein
MIPAGCSCVGFCVGGLESEQGDEFPDTTGDCHFVSRFAVLGCLFGFAVFFH